MQLETKTRVDKLPKKKKASRYKNGETRVLRKMLSAPSYEEIIKEVKKKVGGRPKRPLDLPRGIWTEQALKVLKERYLQKDGEMEVIETPEDMCWRVAWEVASAEATWGKNKKEVKKIACEFYKMMVSHEFLPNSPTLMNAGTGNMLQYSACFVLPIEDSIEGIFDAIKYQALIHKTGGGTGFSFSRLRPNGSIVKTSSGTASGPVSFMRIFDAATNEIKQGGKRRGANMGILRVNHPDILEFIHCKENGGITNFNISVAITDAFMEAYYKNKDYELIDPRTKNVVGALSARKVFNEIADAAWRTGDPGLVFIDRRNRGTSNPVPALGPIEATNPCVTGDTLLYTDKGLVKIEDLYKTKSFFKTLAARCLSDVKFQIPARVVRTGKREVYRLTTQEGYELRLTAEHKVRTENGWIRAQDLKKGDRILLSDRAGGFGIAGSLEEGRILGWLVGDGTIKQTSAVLSAFAENLERKFVDECEEFSASADFAPTKRAEKIPLASASGASSFFGYEKKELAPQFARMVTHLVDGMQAVERPYSVSVVDVKGRDEARIQSVRLARYLEENGLRKGAKLKVPYRVFGGTREMQKGFLQGLFTADGHVEGNSEKGVSVRLTSTSENLLKDVQRVLLNFGIVSKIYTQRRGEKRRLLPDGRGGVKEYLCSAYHDLVISRNSLFIFRSEVGFLSEAKNEKLGILLEKYQRGPYKQGFFARFKVLVKEGIETVYDLTEPATASFIANGLVIHNCGEQELYPFDACNLGSIFLTYFVKDDNGKKEVDWKKLRETTRQSVRFLDDVIEVNPYPLEQIRKTVFNIRRIGLGVGGWADMLVKLGIPYDSNEAMALAGKLMKFIQDEAVATSEEMARQRGPFPLWPASIYKDGVPRRNSTVTTIAPTGSISIIAGAASGIEPLFAVAFQHIVHDGHLDRELVFVNPAFEEIAKKRGFWSEELMEKVAQKGVVRDIKEIPEDVRRVFGTAHEINVEWHVRVQSVFQKYTENAVSKTINLRHDAGVDDVKKAYLMAWETGCKGITVFRDGSKGAQVLNLGIKPPSAESSQGQVVLERPMKVTGATYKIATPLGNAFITVNQDESGNPFEVFITIGKAGSEVAAMAEALGRLISTNFRFGNHLPPRERAREIMQQLQGIGGGRSVGFGPNKIRSLPDAVAKALALHFGFETGGSNLKAGAVMAAYEPAPSGVGDVLKPVQDESDPTPAPAPHQNFGVGAPALFGDICPSCGASSLVYEEGCAKCHLCGYSEC